MAPWIAAVTCAWFALAAAWGMFGPLPAGHYGTMGAEGVIGENIVRWHIVWPVWQYTTAPPTPDMYYCHHPFGGFWIMAVLVAIFGHHNFVLPLPAVLMSAATPPLLYGIARDAWGKVPGAAAAIGFAFLPITVGFSNFHNLEVMVLFSCALFFWGHARMLATWKTRYLVASLVGVALAAASDWLAFVVLGAVLGVSLVRAFVAPKEWFSALSFRLYATWWALAATIAVLVLALWVGLFSHADKLIDWLSSAGTRGMSSQMTLGQALEARKHWIELSFTPLAIFLGKLAAPIALARLLVRRRDEEGYSLAMLAGATVQYVVFKQGAEVHIFWPQPFGGYFALALAQLVATMQDGGKLLARWWPGRRVDELAAMPSLAFTILFGTAMAPDAMRAVRYARETGGRFNEGGHAISSETNIMYVLDRLRDRLPELTGPDVMTPHMMWSMAYKWASHGEGRHVSTLPTEHAGLRDPHPIFMARASGLTPDQQRTLASSFHVEVYADDVWVVDRRLPPSPLEAFALQEREPWPWEWLFFCGWEPIRKYVPDAYSTWEWRTHVGQAAALPQEAPKTAEQIRIAHNMAVEAGDAARAADLRRRLLTECNEEPKADFTQGISLLGYRRVGGVQPRIVLLFESTDESPKSDATFAVEAAVEARKPLSLIPPDPIVREVALPVPLTTKLYRKGFIYSHEVVLRQRIGVERFYGGFQSKDGSPPPVRLDRQAETQLLVAR